MAAKLGLISLRAAFVDYKRGLVMCVYRKQQKNCNSLYVKGIYDEV